MDDGKFHGAALALLLIIGGLAPSSSQAVERQGYAPVNGLRMYYEVHGSGPPLLLLHGGGSSIGTTFGAVLPMLAKHHRVIAVEQQGHGHTADIDRPLSFEQMADDTAALLEILGEKQVDVMGFSNGANVALQLAMRHPEKVRKLIAGSTFYATSGLQPQVRQMFSQPADVSKMPPPLRDDYLKIAPEPKNLQRQAEKIMAMLSGFKDWSPDSLRAIQAPTLVLQGNADIATPEHVIEMCRLIPRCELVMLPGGHGTYLGEVTAAQPRGKLPAITAALVEEFLVL